jgi:II/X family phage/plasmid replication protein
MSSMIDWVTAVVRCSFDGIINDGQVLRVLPTGEIGWSTDARLQVEGSYSSVVAVRGTGVDGVGALEISGNPAKFLQGHNLFGTNDLRGLMAQFLPVLVSLLGIEVTDGDRQSWLSGDYYLKRLDITRMYDLGEQDRVRQFLIACVPVASARQQRTSVTGSTVYIGQHSKRKSLKFYNKLEELSVRGHGLPEEMPVEVKDKLRNYAIGALRVEQTVRGMELDRLGGGSKVLRSGRLWTSAMVEQLMSIYVGGIELNDTMKLNEELAGELPGRLVAVYEAWRAGRDIRSMYSRPTFYRYRSQLLKHGVDIAHTRPREVVAETQYLLGAPLRSFLIGAGKEPPTWSRGTPWLIAS